MPEGRLIDHNNCDKQLTIFVVCGGNPIKATVGSSLDGAARFISTTRREVGSIL